MSTIRTMGQVTVQVAPSTATSIGTPLPSVRTLRLVPILLRSMGFLSAFFPERVFGPRLIQREPGPLHTVLGVIFHKAAASPAWTPASATYASPS